MKCLLNEDVYGVDMSCPNCGGILIYKSGAGISSTYCREPNCNYEDFDYDM